MLNYFLRKQNDAKPININSRMDYIRRRYMYDYYKVMDYYNVSRERAVNNRNILSRLLKMLSNNIDLPVFEYFKYIATDAIYVSKQFDIVSNISKGNIKASQLYGDNVYEAFIYTENEVNLFELEDNWRELRPLRVVYTTTTDLNYGFPYENVDKMLPELVVYELDVVALALQYREWARCRVRDDRSTDHNVFIAMIVLPSVVPDIMDLAVINRFFKIAKGEPILDSKFNIHPFPVIDYRDKVDDVLKGFCNLLKNKPYDVSIVLDSVPMLFGKTTSDVLLLSNSVYTQQSNWLLAVCRLPYIAELIDVLGKRGIAKNKSELSKLPVEIKRLERMYNDIGSMIPDSYLSGLYSSNIDEIKMKIGKR